MRLVVVRHGEAVSRDTDPARPLSERGRAQAKQVGAELAKKGLLAAEVWHSDKARAVQTAEILAQQLPHETALRVEPGLRPNDPVGDLVEILRERKENLIVVSHLPFVAYLVLALCGREVAEELGFRECGTAVLQRNSDGLWALKYAFEPS